MFFRNLGVEIPPDYLAFAVRYALGVVCRGGGPAVRREGLL